ncbi:uncharacterized protein LOC143485952 [Brachyhypopomus gauderio]|uniref:uncharacterized protein LOC143485952 n=1 Tax=Brachyhypopomus gauderio TaxID=698409 RepID=UPI0040433386
MEDTETELTSSEPDALGADFITVELDTQPIEYVVKWAEVGSKFTISCVKKESDENNCFVSDQLVKTETDDRFFASYDYPDCVDAETSLVATQEEEVKSESDAEESVELGSSQLCGEEEEDEEEASEGEWEKLGSHSGGRPYDCHLCSKSYSHSSSLARHLHMHSAGERAAPSPTPPKKGGKPGDGKKFLQCNLCGVRCNGRRLLAIHKKCHKTKRLHTCSTCGKTFNHSSSLSRHRLIHKAGLDKKLKAQYPTAPAPVAPAAGPRSRPAGRGTKKKKKKSPQAGESKPAAGEKQYQCTQCDMVFSTSTGLSKHQVSHVRQLLNSYAQGKDALDKSSDLKIRLKLCSRDKPNCYTLCKKSKRGKGGKKRAGAAGDDRRFGGGGRRRPRAVARRREALHVQRV